MTLKYLILLNILCLCCGSKVISQDTNLARLEYVFIPQAKSDNVYSSVRISGNYPRAINEKGAYLVTSFQYRYNSLQLNDPILVSGKEGLQDFHTIGLGVGYTFKMKNNWRFGGKLGIRVSSNFEGSGIGADDLRYTGSVYFIKSNGSKEDVKMSRLVIGVRYTTPASINFPLPIINYYKKINTSWSYSLGTPKTNIKYFFNKKNSIQAFVGLDRFYGNIQNNRLFVDNDGVQQVAGNASMLIVNSVFGYEHYFTEYLLFFVYTGYTLINEIRLRDNKQNNVLSINDKNTLYIRGGIKFKL